MIKWTHHVTDLSVVENSMGMYSWYYLSLILSVVLFWVHNLNVNVVGVFVCSLGTTFWVLANAFKTKWHLYRWRCNANITIPPTLQYATSWIHFAVMKLCWTTEKLSSDGWIVWRWLQQMTMPASFGYSCLRWTPEHRAMAYVSLVRSLMEYCAIVWDSHLQDIDTLEGIHRRLAWLIKMDCSSREPGCVTTMLSELDPKPLQERRKHLYKL